MIVLTNNNMENNNNNNKKKMKKWKGASVDYRWTDRVYQIART